MSTRMSHAKVVSLYKCCFLVLLLQATSGAVVSGGEASSGRFADTTHSATAATAGMGTAQIDTISVYFLSQYRLDSLQRALLSVDAAAKEAMQAASCSVVTVDVSVHIDIACKHSNASPAFRAATQALSTWQWGSHRVACVHGSAPGGILAQWARVPPAASATQAVLVVEDDVVLAPGALVALASLWGSVARAPTTATAGVSLHHLGYSAREGRHFDASFCHSVVPMANASGVSTYRSPVVSTWAFSPHPVAWGAFTRWLAARGIASGADNSDTAPGHTYERGSHALSEVRVNVSALAAALTRAADTVHARQKRCLGGSCEQSAPYASLLWGMEDIRGGRGHQIWSAAFHAFSVLSAGLADPAHTWAYETVYPCFPRAPDGKSQVAALHMKATGVHHSAGSAAGGVEGVHFVSTGVAGGCPARAVVQGTVLDWFGSALQFESSASDQLINTGVSSSDSARSLDKSPAMPASTAFNRGAPGSLTTPSGAAMNKVAHASDDIARTLQSMAWRGIASPFGSMLTRGHDYLEAVRGRTIVFFGDSTDRRMLAALYDLIVMGRYHVTLDLDMRCFGNAPIAAAFCRSNSSATYLKADSPSDWMHMHIPSLNASIAFCLLRLSQSVNGHVPPISEIVQGCANSSAALLAKPGVIAVVNGWMHFLALLNPRGFVPQMAAMVGSMVQTVHRVLPRGSPIIIRSPLPYFNKRYLQLGTVPSMASLTAWASVREKLRLGAPGRKLIEWDVFTPFFQASSSNAFKHSKTTDGMHPGAASALSMCVMFIELLQTELPVPLPPAAELYPPLTLPAWEHAVNELGGNATAAAGGYDYDQCPDCDCRFECRFWGGVKQDGDCGNGTRNGSSWGVSSMFGADAHTWVRARWGRKAPKGAWACVVGIGCVGFMLLAGHCSRLWSSDAVCVRCLRAVLVLLCVCLLAAVGNDMPPAMQLLNDEGAVLFTPIALLVLLLPLGEASSVAAAAPAASCRIDIGARPQSRPAGEEDLLLPTQEEAADVAKLVEELTSQSQGGQLEAHAETARRLEEGSAAPPQRLSTANTVHVAAVYGVQRELTEEWKGWMQLWFLLYHVLRAEAAYPYIRWTVSAYVFLTGYGNTLYYFGSGKVSTKRIAGMLLRMCLFSVLLAGATGTPWYLYYIPFLHAVHYITTTAACLLAMQLQGRFEAPLGFLHASAVVCALLPGVLLETQVGSDMVGIVLQTVFGPTGGTYLLMRLRLDRYSSAVGILGALVVLAANAHAASAPRGKPAGVWAGLCDGILGRWHTARQVIAAALVTAGVAVAVTHPLRAEYKLVNAYVGTLWIPAYLELRLRVLPRLQRWMAGADAQAQLKVHVSRVLAWFGRHSLECYLLQFHLLMTASAGAILVLLPQAPLVSLLLQAVMYTRAAAIAFSATSALREYLQ